MKTILKLSFCFITILSYSQTPTFEWVKSWGYITSGTTNNTTAFDIAVDANNNSYVLSTGDTQVNFNTGNGSIISAPSQGCGAISKFDPNGNLIWVKFIIKSGGTSGSCIPQKIEIKNNILYYSGVFGGGGGIYDFDFGINNTNINGLTSGQTQCFISKLDLDGNFFWVKTLGETTTEIKDLTIDYNNDLIFIGDFQNSLSIGSQNLTSNGGSDVFVSKINSLGNFMWSKSFGSNNTSLATSSLDIGNGVVTIDNHIYLTGYFSGSCDFDPNNGVSNNISNGSSDLFILKLDENSNFIWVQTFGTINGDRGLTITKDYNNNLFVSGIMGVGIIDFNYGINSNNEQLFSSGMFIYKFNQNGDFLWSKSFPNSIGRNSTCDLNGNYFLTGDFYGNVDFDYSSNIFYLSATGTSNSFILKLDNGGNFNWAGTLIGEGSPYNYENKPTNIIASNIGIWVSGEFKGNVDFDPNSSQFVVSSSRNNSNVPFNSAFNLKFKNCLQSNSSINVNVCQSYTWSLNNTTYTNSGVYSDTLVNMYGCDSIITLNLTILPVQTNVVSITQCDSYTSPQGNTYNTSGAYNETYSNISGCDSIVTINLTITNLQNTVSISNCGNYISPLGNSYSSSGTYQEIYTTQSGCDSTVNILLTINNSITVNQSITACSSFTSPTGNNYTQSGQYFDTLTTVSGCDSIIVTQLTILNPTTSTISPVVCSSYTSPSGNIYNQTGTYIDTIQNVNGCDSIITINLSVIGALNVNAGPDVNICVGGSIVLTANGATNYIWTNGITNGIAFSPSSTNYYSVTGTDGNGCIGKDSVLVTVNNLPSIAFNYLLPDCQGGITGSINTQVTGANPITYQWSNGSTNQNLQAVSTGNYSLNVTDGNGCTVTQNFNLPDGEGDCLIIPTGFTPNGDNQNDTWQIIGIENFSKNYVQVFNRWGQTVFESQGTVVNWNGKYKDEMLPVADYYFVVDLGNGQVFNGTITLKY